MWASTFRWPFSVHCLSVKTNGVKIKPTIRKYLVSILASTQRINWRKTCYNYVLYLFLEQCLHYKCQDLGVPHKEETLNHVDMLWWNFPMKYCDINLKYFFSIFARPLQNCMNKMRSDVQTMSRMSFKIESEIKDQIEAILRVHHQQNILANNFSNADHLDLSVSISPECRSAFISSVQLLKSQS